MSIGAEVPISSRVGGRALTGVFLDTSGTFSLRDVQLALPVLAVRKPTAVWRIAPGLSLPLGSVSSRYDYTLLTTGSLDPTLTSDLIVGGSWLMLLDGSVRVPLHPGFDRIRQGVYGRTGARVARRLGGGAVAMGLSLGGQQQRGLTSPGFVELAGVASLQAPLNERWGLGIDARVPMWTGDTPSPYLAALSLSVRRVFGEP